MGFNLQSLPAPPATYDQRYMRDLVSIIRDLEGLSSKRDNYISTGSLRLKFPTGVIGLSITTAGSGATAGTLSASGGGGIGFAGTYTVDGGGGLTSVKITQHGSGYTTVPTIVLSNPGTGEGIEGTIGDGQFHKIIFDHNGLVKTTTA